MEFRDQVVVHRKGRNGQVVVTQGADRFSFYWEFGGGDCLAMIEVPDAQSWRALEPHCHYARHEFLRGLAAEVARRECPGARIEIGDNTVYFYTASSAGH